VTLIIRGSGVLRTFDAMISQAATDQVPTLPKVSNICNYKYF
jgi:hypothetical protein